MNNWIDTTLGSDDPRLLLEMRNGLVLNQLTDSGNYRITRIETISDEKIDLNRTRWVTNVTPDKVEKYGLKKGDILFSHINSDEHIGKTALVEKDYPHVLHGMNLLLIKSNPKVINPEFLNYYFKFLRKEGEFKRICNRAVNQSSINQAKLKDVKIHLPSLIIQSKIILILSLLQKTIEQQEKIIEITTELKDSLMQKLFTEGLNQEPQKDTKIGLFPKSWKKEKLGDVCNVNAGGTPDRKNNSYWENGTVPWVKTGEVDYRIINDTEEKITDLGLKNSSAKIFAKDTLLMAMYGQGVTRGKVAILGIDASTNQACTAIIPKDKSQVFNLYLYYYFQYSYERIRDFGHGANQKNLSGTIIKSFIIPIPSFEEQKNISRILSKLDQKIELTNLIKIKHEKMFDSMLYQLISGELSVEDISFN